MGEIYDEFARRVISSRIEKYKEPELKEKEPTIVYKYFNPTRERYGIVIGIINVSKSTMKDLKEALKMVDEDVKELSIVIYSKTAKKNLEDVRFEVSKIRNIKISTVLHGGEFPMFNLMRHIRVPLHVVLTEDEKYEVIQRYRIPEEEITKFPILREKDPVARLIGAKSGDMVMIVRSSETAGQALYYRYVTRIIGSEEIGRKRIRI